jgi:protein-arginine kinase
MIDLSMLPDRGAGWLDASGEQSEIVLSTRIRLARNVAGFAFAPRARDMAVVGSLMGHLVYGGLLGAIAGGTTK